MNQHYIIVGCDNHCIEVFSGTTGKHLETLRGHQGGVWALQFVEKVNMAHVLVSGGCDR